VRRFVRFGPRLRVTGAAILIVVIRGLTGSAPALAAPDATSDLEQLSHLENSIAPASDK
jgi:hypothetical protein